MSFSMEMYSVADQSETHTNPHIHQPYAFFSKTKTSPTSPNKVPEGQHHALIPSYQQPFTTSALSRTSQNRLGSFGDAFDIPTYLVEDEGFALNQTSNATLHLPQVHAGLASWDSEPTLSSYGNGAHEEFASLGFDENFVPTYRQYGHAHEQYYHSQSPRGQLQTDEQPVPLQHLSTSPGFGPVGPIDRADANIIQQQSPNVTQRASFNQCNWPGCPLGPGGAKPKMFKRKYELDRHMRKHNPQKTYACSAINCKKQFYRSDKLKDHVRKAHDEKTFFACPVKDCGLHKLLVPMRDHVGDHDGHTHQQYRDDFAALT